MTSKLKLELSAQKDNEILYTNWQIARLSNDFSEFYYKSVLLYDISQYLKEGVRKNDIIIFNSSININSQYIKYKVPQLDLSNPKDIVKYYHLGSPISLYPNKKISILHEIFEAYRVYFSILNKHKLNLGSKTEDLLELFNISRQISETSFDFRFVKFFEEKVIENNDLQTNNREKCIQEIRTSFKSKDEELIDLVNKFDENSPSKQFNYIFNRYERPIIGVHTTSERIDLLGSDFFVQSEFTYANSRFLETNSIEQNSPLKMLLTMSVIIIPNLWLILKEKLNLMRQQSHNNNLDQKISDLETEISNLEKKAQQEGISLNQATQLPDLKNTVIKKGESVLNEFRTTIIEEKQQ